MSREEISDSQVANAWTGDQQGGARELGQFILKELAGGAAGTRGPMGRWVLGSRFAEFLCPPEGRFETLAALMLALEYVRPVLSKIG